MGGRLALARVFYARGKFDEYVRQTRGGFGSPEPGEGISFAKCARSLRPLSEAAPDSPSPRSRTPRH